MVFLFEHEQCSRAPGWGWHTTQLYGDYFISQYKDPYKLTRIQRFMSWWFLVGCSHDGFCFLPVYQVNTVSKIDVTSYKFPVPPWKTTNFIHLEIWFFSTAKMWKTSLHQVTGPYGCFGGMIVVLGWFFLDFFLSVFFVFLPETGHLLD